MVDNRSEKDILRAIIECAYETKNNRELLKIVVERFLPKVNGSNRYDWLYDQWKGGSSRYVEEIKTLDNNIPKELEQDFVRLKQEVIAVGISDYCVASRIHAIQQIFQDKEKHGFQYTNLVYAEMYTLLDLLLTMDMDNIVMGYAKIKPSIFRMRNVYTGNLETNPRFIYELIIAPSLSKKRHLQMIFHNSEIAIVWVAFEILYLIDRCWTTPRSFFDTATSNEDIDTFRKQWEEIDALKTNPDDKRFLTSSIFTKEKILSAMRTLYLAMYQEAGKVASYDEHANILLTLKLQYIPWAYYLVLEVDNLDTMTVEQYQLHCFRDESAVFNITELLLKNEGIIDLSKIPNSGAFKDAAKYLERASLRNIVGNIFIERKAATIRLKNNPIRVADLSKDDRAKLFDFLSSLK